MICDNCKYKGVLPEDCEQYIIYAGGRCINSNCIFYKCPISGLVKSGLTRCKKFKEKNNAQSIE